LILQGGLAGGGAAIARALQGGLAGGGAAIARALQGGLAGGGAAIAMPVQGGLAGGGDSSPMYVDIFRFVQGAKASSANTTGTINTSVTWGASTKANNFLIAFQFIRKDTATTLSAVGAPAGWVNRLAYTLGNISIRIWSLDSAAAQSSTGNFTLTATGGNANQDILTEEWYCGGYSAVFVFGGAGHNTATGSPFKSGTINPSGSREMAFVFGACNPGSANFTSPTSGFTIDQSVTASTISVCTSYLDSPFTTLPISTQIGATPAVLSTWISAWIALVSPLP
jgi:hypothetical protein